MNSSTSVKIIEDVLFNLHPHAKTLYSTIAILKEQPSDPIVENTQPNDQQVQELPSNHFVAKKHEYSPEASLQNRVLNIITELGQFVKVNEILAKIQEYEPDYQPRLSSALTALKTQGLIKNYSSTGSKRDTFWGLIDWNN